MSTSNLGPGFDTFSVTVEQEIKISWEPAEKTELVRKGALGESILSVGGDPVLRGLKRASILANKKLPNGKIEVSSTVPPGRGLGASGAGIVGGLLLGNKICNGGLKPELLHREAIQLEGHPENATGSFLGGSHWSIQDPKESWLHLPVTLHRDLRLLFILPPYPLSTKRAREVLPSSVSFPRAAAQARRTPILLEGLRTLDERAIQIGIQDELHVEARLRQLTGAKGLLGFAVRAGGIAATLSGAGSALLVLTRTGQMSQVETRLKRRVKRLWGESGSVIRSRVQPHGASFN
jgi:homoserine kinase